MKRPIIAGCFALLTFASLSADDKQARVLMQAAETKATVQGDLRGAITLYETAVKEAGSNRALASQALVRIAEAYQKLGDTEARKIYERLVRDYADQRDVVAVARSFLDGNPAVKAEGMVSRKAWTTEGDVFGNVSPDGRYIPYSDYNFGVILHDLKTGTNRPLTDMRGQGQVDASGTGAWAFSRDGKQLAYSWDDYKALNNVLRVVDVQGPGIQPSRTLVDNREISVILPHDWSPDGKWIAVTLARADRSVQIALASTADGSVRVLKSIDWRFPKHMYFSPDGKYLAFDLQGDVFILAVDGSREIPAVIYPTEEQLAGWSPDGTYLLFMSDRLGSMSLWASRFAAGQVIGLPDLIKRDIGETIETAGVTAIGGLYFVVSSNGKTIGNANRDILRATFDFSAGKFLSPPAPAVTTFMGTNRQPSWSPDGKYLAYISRDFTIGIRSIESGDTREVSLSREIVYLLGLMWASDSRSFIINGTDAKGRGGIFRVDAQTLRTTLIVHPDSNNRNDVSAIGEAPDGKHLYYRFWTAGRDAVSVIRRDLVTGTETELIRRPSLRLPNLDQVLSPNGHFIAGSYQNDATTPMNSVLVVGADGGEPTELMRDRDVRVAMWAPDSRSLFVRKGQELWRAPLGGGQPTKLDVTLDPTWAFLRVHPDGREIAIQTIIPAKPAELWVLENFLPSSSVKAATVANTASARPK